MAKVHKIQDRDWLYAILRPWVDYGLKRSYRSIRYIGREKLPQDGAIIYAPNHTNGLMDALVILAMDRRAKVFVARADLFRNPLLAKILNFLKIMPIMRIRDGYDEVKKNNETIEKAVDVLRDRVPFCIFPEGTHQPKHSALPLSKGIFRIALQAQQQMPDLPLYIVPVGIRYGNFFRFRSTARVAIGDPISIGDFSAAHSDSSPQEQMNLLKDLLTERMHALIHYIPNDENYDAACEVSAATFKERFHKTDSVVIRHRLDRLFTANKENLEEMARLTREEPERAEQLFRLGRKTFSLRRKQKISLESVAMRRTGGFILLRVLLLLVLLPYALFAGLCTLPVVGISQLLSSLFQDRSFYNSARYLVHLLLWPLLLITYTLVAFLTLPLGWAALLLTLILPTLTFVQEYWRACRLTVSDIRLRRSHDLQERYERIRQIFTNQRS